MATPTMFRPESAIASPWDWIGVGAIKPEEASLPVRAAGRQAWLKCSMGLGTPSPWTRIFASARKASASAADMLATSGCSL